LICKEKLNGSENGEDDVNENLNEYKEVTTECIDDSTLLAEFNKYTMGTEV
jgi:hypothetical protein